MDEIPCLETDLEIQKIQQDVFEACDLYSLNISGTADIAYGGHLVAQAVKAAFLTLPVDSDHLLNSIHCYFMCPAKPEKIRYHVNDKKDGHLFCYRSVSAQQNGKNVFSCTVSFQSPDTHAGDLPYNYHCKPSVPGPSDSIPSEKLKNIYITAIDDRYPIYVRFCSPPPWDKKDNQDSSTAPITPLDPQVSVWIKPKIPLQTSDQNEHRIAMTYATDFAMPGGVLRQYPGYKFTLLTSLNHCVWFESDVDFNEWHLFDIQCLSSKGGGTLNMSRIFREDGTLVATAMQQGYIQGPKL